MKASRSFFRNLTRSLAGISGASTNSIRSFEAGPVLRYGTFTCAVFIHLEATEEEADSSDPYKTHVCSQDC